MRAGYHVPTLLKTHKIVLDLSIPAPHENWDFSHYSSNQNGIQEEIRRTYQKINAKRAKLKTEKMTS